VPVRWIDEVLDLALERPIAPANAVSALGDGVKKAKADAKPERGRKKRAGDGARDAEKSANRNTRGAVKH
jgi:hypothetical protein